MKTVEWRRGGYLLALESDAGDMIANGLMNSPMGLHDISTLDGVLTPEFLLLIPCPFIIDCDGENGQFACADCEEIPLQSKADAIARGWKDVRFDPFALGASYLGTCPKCQLEDK